MTRPTWTKKPPSAPGWYWWRDTERSEPTLALVRYQAGFFVAIFATYRDAYPLAECRFGLWSKRPIEVPK